MVGATLLPGCSAKILYTAACIWLSLVSFAAQLKTDLGHLATDNAVAKKHISLCAKWAPSSERFADKHTFIVSSIAEILHPVSEFQGFADYDPQDIEQRILYLRHAREAYRKDVAALRKHLQVIERDMTAKDYKNIKHDRVPSLAMNNNVRRFAEKDPERFEKYIEKVADGKARISGAMLLPSTLVRAARLGKHTRGESYDMIAGKRKKEKGTKDLVESKVPGMEGKALDGQWRTLVQRIRDSGTLENCIAMADVSGSMTGPPEFPDGTTPLDSSIGLSLLIAEVSKPPFGGAFITFSKDPKVEKIDLSWNFRKKVDHLSRAHWNMSTDFVAVFEKLILPTAIKNQPKREDMVKCIFVFSDMRFNSAGNPPPDDPDGFPVPRAKQHDRWSTSYERIEKLFHNAGYEMPELVFWNLAGGRAGYLGGTDSDDLVAPKPVTAEQPGTAIVSGYSQGMLKMFLENGSFEDGDEDAGEQIVEAIGADGAVVLDKAKKQKLDPLSVVKKAISHRSYDMLWVID
ncbi:unnamed protein product [Discula destructiva]